jgi:hypothetical protein
LAILTDWTLAWRAARFIDFLLVVAGIWQTLVEREADRDPLSRRQARAAG